MKNSNSIFGNFGNVLGRSEMKKLMAGSGGNCDGTECKYDRIGGFRCFYTGITGITCDDSGYPSCQERPC